MTGTFQGWAVALALLAGCSTSPPTVAQVDPTEAAPGADITVLGSGFTSASSLTLETAERRIPVQTRDISAVTILGVLPEDLPAGAYDVVVTEAEQSARVTAGLTVKVIPDDAPCSVDYTANTQLSLAREVAVVDRFYRSGERETIRVALSDVDKVEYELVRTDRGLCSAIYLKRNDGGRTLFADDLEVDLKQRAYRIGNDIGKSVDVTREDAEGMADAEE